MAKKKPNKTTRHSTGKVAWFNPFVAGLSLLIGLFVLAIFFPIPPIYLVITSPEAFTNQTDVALACAFNAPIILGVGMTLWNTLKNNPVLLMAATVLLSFTLSYVMLLLEIFVSYMVYRAHQGIL